MRPIDETTVLVTGAGSGLGRAVAGKLAAAGAVVLLHGRDPERGQRALRELREQSGDDRHRFYQADFSSLAEVRRLAERVAADSERLDVLVNNAGIGSTNQDGSAARQVSRDGYELRLQVNYLAGFLLTIELLPLLRRSAPARVINVASAGQARFDFDDPQLLSGYSGWRAYGQSKLAQVMFTFELAERLACTGVTANTLHPATFMDTAMVRRAGVQPVSTVEQGATATMRLITAPELEGVTGAYFNGTREARPDPQAYDPDARRALWDLSKLLVEPARAGG